MNDVAAKLASKFKKQSRYPNFGSCINSIEIVGFRGITCKLDFEFPVTAVTGLNGAGKSTVGQLLLCAYKSVSTSAYKRWYIKDFFPVSVADPTPFDLDALVTYEYQTSSIHENQSLTVSRAIKEWSGYKRQPEKASLYLGLTFYLPKVERRDLTIYAAHNIELSDRSEVDDGPMWASRILGNKYDDVFFQKVESPKRWAELGMAKRLDATYSENNMGFGEGRVIHTIKVLETCPLRSLIVLEEPETSLHEYAQYEFSKYLMDVASRRGHQIFFSSHSSAMIRALPPQGRKMLSRDKDGVKVYDRLSSIHIRNALTEGHDGHLIVCVEDAFAQSLLREMIRQKRPSLLGRIKVLPFGDAISVQAAVQNLVKSEVKAVGVRDGDQPEKQQEKLRSFPGGCAPEKLVFLSDPVKQTLKDLYQFDLDQHITAHPESDHHKYAVAATKQLAVSREVIETDCIRAFLQAQSGNWADDLLEWIDKEA